jgi:hypothetical protein
LFFVLVLWLPWRSKPESTDRCLCISHPQELVHTPWKPDTMVLRVSKVNGWRTWPTIFAGMCHGQGIRYASEIDARCEERD